MSAKTKKPQAPKKTSKPHNAQNRKRPVQPRGPLQSIEGEPAAPLPFKHLLDFHVREVESRDFRGNYNETSRTTSSAVMLHDDVAKGLGVIGSVVSKLVDRIEPATFKDLLTIGQQFAAMFIATKFGPKTVPVAPDGRGVAA